MNRVASVSLAATITALSSMASNSEASSLRQRQTQSDLREPAEGSRNMPVQPPAEFHVQAGTWVTVRLKDFVSTDVNSPEDKFIGVLTQPVVVNGFVVARRGQLVSGRVTDSKRAGRLKGLAQLGMELNELSIADGRQVPIRTFRETLGGASPTRRPINSYRNFTAVTSVAMTGASLGYASGQATGAGIGGLAGAGAASFVILLKRGPAALVGPETEITFRIAEPVHVETKGVEPAFRPVDQQDFEARPQVVY